MDENKMFDLLEKIYVEVQEIKKDVKSHTDKFNNVDNRLDGIENEIKKYKELLDEGIITEEKFSIKEKELLRK